MCILLLFTLRGMLQQDFGATETWFKSQPYQYLLCDATQAPSSLWASPCEKANT